MPLLRAYDEIPNPRVMKELSGGWTSWRTSFLNDRAEKTHDGHQAFLAEGSAGRLLRTHFHGVDQFQVICVGDGNLGPHELKFGTVHFARAYTPYGPISYGPGGLGFFTLRAHSDTIGAQYIPDKRAILEQMPNRRPRQISAVPDLDLVPGPDGSASKPIAGLTDERGLAGLSVVLKPGARFLAPAPSTGDGQYVVVLRGGIVHEGREKRSFVVVWVGPDEARFGIEAGAEGCTALVLNFPKPIDQAAKTSSEAKVESASYHCALCGYVYDESAGAPEMGVAPGTRWTDVPESFKCPDCAATKKDFEALGF